jgi:hypothetical protein
VFILKVAEAQGGEGEGERERGETGGWSSSFFAREELWSRGSVSDSWDKFLRKKNKSTQIKSNGARASVKLLHIIIML